MGRTETCPFNVLASIYEKNGWAVLSEKTPGIANDLSPRKK